MRRGYGLTGGDAVEDFLLFLPQNRGTSESNSVTIQKQMSIDKNRSILLLSDRPLMVW